MYYDKILLQHGHYDLQRLTQENSDDQFAQRNGCQGREPRAQTLPKRLSHDKRLQSGIPVLYFGIPEQGSGIRIHQIPASTLCAFVFR